MIGEHVYINGGFQPKEKAQVSVFDHGFIYGDAVFEGVAVAEKAIFKLDAHLDRLADSARYLGIAYPENGGLRAAAIETARRNGLVEGYLRILLTRGAGPVGIRNMDQLSAPTTVVIAQHEKREGRRHIYENGLSAIISSYRRTPSECVDAKAKTCNYINNILAYQEARAAGADTAIMLDIDGRVAEGYAANLFIVRDGGVLTPALGSILNGITRQTVLTLCEQLGLRAREASLTTHDLYCADEVFETGSLAEIKPIRAIGGRAIGKGAPGPIARRIHEALRGLMASKSDSVLF